MLKTVLLAVLLVFFLGTRADVIAQGDAVAAVVSLEVKPSDAAYQKASAIKPIELVSSDAAADYFTDAQMKAINEQVDWSKQVVLVFAWHGSGGDTHTGTAVEQDGKTSVVFRYRRGLTRDLRRHTRVYAVDSAVEWRVQK